MAEYRALRPLYDPQRPEVLRRLVAGENIPFRERGPIKRVAKGAVVSDIPPASVRVLLEKGWIERAVVAPPETATEEAD